MSYECARKHYKYKITYNKLFEVFIYISKGDYGKIDLKKRCNEWLCRSQRHITEKTPQHTGKKKYFHQWDTITLYLVSLMVFAMPQRLLMSLLKRQGVRLTHLSIYIFFKLKKLKLQDNFVLVLIQSYLIFGFWSQYDL